jgi:hypothetical protein
VQIGQEIHGGDLVEQWSIMIGLDEPWPPAEERCIVAGEEPLDDVAIAMSVKKPEKVVDRRQLAIIPSSEERAPRTVPT